MLNAKSQKKKSTGFGITPYLFVIPGMLLFFLIAVIPIFQTFGLSFTDWDGVKAFSSINIIGLDNYKTVITGQEFLIALKNNMIWALVSVTVPIAIGLVQAAVIVNSDVKCKNLFQLLLFLPQILSSMIMSIMWLAIYDPASGLLNEALKMVGLDSFAQPWLGDKCTAIYALLVMSIWTAYGFNTVIYCTAIRSVDQAMYEAAKIDGANFLQTFFRITIPSISKTTTTLLLLSLIGAFKVFDVVFQMTKGGPGYYTYVMSYYLYQTAFASNKIGLGCSIAVLLTIIVFVVSRVFQRLRKEE
ncbi:carbohydrate ABC transporter permease [Blautia sp.]|uniref:carbohydrate ABC transporter permease n=1 Tax=Blautia sp. TaxID=1955243 RepID=UPI00258F2D17|nr:sugar ABC transporter permease [Blautia sp.]